MPQGIVLFHRLYFTTITQSFILTFMKNRIDLHTHSNSSDGTLSPSALMQLASEAGLTAIALTDHDTTAGLLEAQAAADTLGLELVRGIELSAAYQDKEVHIVGLDVDPSQHSFQEVLDTFRHKRDARNAAIAECMYQDGIDISIEMMNDRFSGAVLTRAHFARILMEQGRVTSINEAFRLYLSKGKPYYKPRERFAAQDAVRLLRDNGAIPILAHPFQYKFHAEQLDGLVRALREEGLCGMEAYYSSHTPMQTGEALALIRRYGLRPSGGSDYHGANKPDIRLGVGFGNLHITADILERLREKAKEKR